MDQKITVQRLISNFLFLSAGIIDDLGRGYVKCDFSASEALGVKALRLETAAKSLAYLKETGTLFSGQTENWFALTLSELYAARGKRLPLPADVFNQFIFSANQLATTSWRSCLQDILKNEHTTLAAQIKVYVHHLKHVPFALRGLETLARACVRDGVPFDPFGPAAEEFTPRAPTAEEAEAILRATSKMH